MEPVIIDADDVALEAEETTLFKDAIEEFERSQQTLGDEYLTHCEQAWSLLANQVVGRENI